MTAVLLALGASLAWGVADFVGPWKARTLGTFRVLLWAQVGGLTFIALIAAARANPPEDWAVLLAVPAALSGTLWLYAYYRGMLTGMMSVVAPIAGVSAAFPDTISTVSLWMSCRSSVTVPGTGHVPFGDAADAGLSRALLQSRNEAVAVL